MIGRLMQTPGCGLRRAWPVAALLIVLSEPSVAQAPAADRARPEARPLEPMAVSQLEPSRPDVPAQTVPRTLQAPRDVPQTLQPLVVTQLDERQRDVCLEHGFRPSFYSLQIQGLCAECQKSE